jgi:hypothetical protein
VTRRSRSRSRPRSSTGRRRTDLTQPLRVQRPERRFGAVPSGVEAFRWLAVESRGTIASRSGTPRPGTHRRCTVPSGRKRSRRWRSHRRSRPRGRVSPPDRWTNVANHGAAKQWWGVGGHGEGIAPVDGAPDRVGPLVSSIGIRHRYGGQVVHPRPPFGPHHPGQSPLPSRGDRRTVGLRRRERPGRTWGVGHGRRQDDSIGIADRWAPHPGRHEPSNHGESTSRPGLGAARHR